MISVTTTQVQLNNDEVQHNFEGNGHAGRAHQESEACASRTEEKAGTR